MPSHFPADIPSDAKLKAISEAQKQVQYLDRLSDDYHRNDMPALAKDLTEARRTIINLLYHAQR